MLRLPYGKVRETPRAYLLKNQYGVETLFFPNFFFNLNRFSLVFSKNTKKRNPFQLRISRPCLRGVTVFQFREFVIFHEKLIFY